VESTKRQLRIAGLLYVLVAITGPIGLIYVPGKVYEPGDATATAEHLRSLEPLVRLGIASELFHQVVEIFMVLILYDVFKPVSRTLARQLAVLGLIPIAIVFLNVLNEVAALIFASGAHYLAVFDKTQLDSLALVFIRLHQQGFQVAAVYWGLWLFPLGLLILRCGFIPKVLGISVMIGGAGYVLGSIVALVLPQYTTPFGDIAGILELGELPIIAWLAIWGARVRERTAPPQQAAGG